MILTFRVTPFTSSDLLLLKDGVNVASKYLSLLALAVPGGPSGTGHRRAGGAGFPYSGGEKRPKLPYSVTAILCTFLAAWGLIFVGQKTELLETKFRELSQSYKRNGFLLLLWRQPHRRGHQPAGGSIPPRPSRG
ncbi:MAG: hypothetical protein ACLR2E_13090 [Lachnospiraceae bacterium]